MVRIQWELLGQNIVKGFEPCVAVSPFKYDLVSSDLNLGVLSSTEQSRVFILKGTAYKLDTNGGVIPPDNPITDVKVFLGTYPTVTETVTLLAGEGQYCDGSTMQSIDGYQGSLNAATDISYLLAQGDNGYGMLVSFNRGRTFEAFSTTYGDPSNIATHILVPTTAMSIGTVDGELLPEDSIEVHLKVLMPPSISDSEIGLRQCMLASSYTYTS